MPGKDAPKPSRSKKAGRPRAEVPVTPRVRRRLKTATAAVQKDTTLFQTGEGPRARWPAAKPKFHKR